MRSLKLKQQSLMEFTERFTYKHGVVVVLLGLSLCQMNLSSTPWIPPLLFEFEGLLAAVEGILLLLIAEGWMWTFAVRNRCQSLLLKHL